MLRSNEEIRPLRYDAPSNTNYGAASADEYQGDTMGLVNEEGRKRPQYVAALAATLGALASGAVLAFTSPTEKAYTTEAFLGFNVTSEDFKWVGSLTPLGALVMCIPIGFILDGIGRKVTMLSMIAIFSVGWALIIWTQNTGMLMGGRFLTGIACGTFCIAAPLYTSEIAQKEIRGSLGSYFQLMITIGILFVYVVGSFINPQNLAIICGVLPFIFGIAFVFMPESPVYALKRGRDTKARDSLQWLRGEGYNVEDEIRDIKDALEEDKRNPISIRQSLKKTATQKALFISFGLMFFQQMSGINAVIFYTSNIFDSAGSELQPEFASIIVGVMQTAGTLVSTLIIERLGRRILLLMSAGIMGICCLLLGVFFYLKDHNAASESTIKSLGFLPILSLSIFIILFSLGFGPIPWMISAEIYPREIKSVASAAAGTFNWFLAFLVTLFFPDIKRAIGGDNAFFIFTVCCAVGVVFVYFIVPETKGKTLEEIQRELGSRGRPRHSDARGVINEGFS